MDHSKPQNPATEPAAKSGPLTKLVDDELNDSLADQVVKQLEKREEAARSSSEDYARGTSEHEDDTEA